MNLIIKEVSDGDTLVGIELKIDNQVFHILKSKSSEGLIGGGISPGFTEEYKRQILSRKTIFDHDGG